ncbi:DKNYY domain-containing protein [uncultured Roseobacter sp.]|uniref:DKNYY domain-containing protein n=1 Tax=uncultured Roseobacter sp. TaxID=114847 RepID=UPI002614120D|nr:DKNYY domain-containing protein [uncultured Roseobacter sp.]
MFFKKVIVRIVAILILCAVIMALFVLAWQETLEQVVYREKFHGLSSSSHNKLMVGSSTLVWDGLEVFGADSQTFQILNGFWAIDSGSVFGPGCFREGAPGCIEVLKGADRFSFQSHNSEIASDINYVYAVTGKINTVDRYGKSIRVVNERLFWVEQSLFVDGRRVNVPVDYKTFELIDQKKAKDKNSDFEIRTEGLVPIGI